MEQRLPAAAAGAAAGGAAAELRVEKVPTHHVAARALKLVTLSEDMGRRWAWV